MIPVPLAQAQEGAFSGFFFSFSETYINFRHAKEGEKVLRLPRTNLAGRGASAGGRG